MSLCNNDSLSKIGTLLLDESLKEKRRTEKDVKRALLRKINVGMVQPAPKEFCGVATI